jgi:DNA-3-methyladenine glycosylase I
MQATGMVNDHLVDCHRYEPCAALQRKFKIGLKIGGERRRA